MKSLVLLLISLLALISCKKYERSTELIHESVPIKNNSNRAWIEGWLSVDENRLELKSNLIKIPFILSKAPDSLKESDAPILIMSGGPGNSSLHMANGIVNTPWGQTRDIIIMEQRGTFYAKPSLVCPEIDSLRILGLKNGLWGKALDSLKMLSVEKCFIRLKDQGINLDGYNTLESLEDIEELRKALNLDKFILYGMSYSCNLMKAYARTYPSNVKALILDSPLPHEVNYDEEAFKNIDNTLIKLVKYYSGTDKLYRDWKNYIGLIQDSVFSILIDSSKYHYTKNELIDILMFSMSTHNTLSDVTESIKEIVSGDHSKISNIIHYYLETSNQALGMRYSVWIGEELPDEHQDSITINENSYTWLKGYSINDVSFKTAKYWQTNSIYDKREWPNKEYAGPVLILSGEFDPWTPVSYGLIMKDHLPNSKHIIYPESTHLPGFTKQGFNDIAVFLKSVSK